MEYYKFISMSRNVQEKAGSRSESFLGTLINLTKEVNLSAEILDLLVDYYHNMYDHSFITLSRVHNSSEESIVVLPKANQFSRIRIRAEVIKLTFVLRHIRSANVLSQFVLDDNTTDTFSGQVQFFFKHTIQLPEGLTMYTLTFVRWYKAAKD